MAYIITSSKSGRRSNPDGRMVEMEHREFGDVRIVTERGAEKRLRRNIGWDDPIPARNSEQPK
mgnify:CR=1 FL=1